MWLIIGNDESNQTIGVNNQTKNLLALSTSPKCGPSKTPKNHSFNVSPGCVQVPPKRLCSNDYKRPRPVPAGRHAA